MASNIQSNFLRALSVLLLCAPLAWGQWSSSAATNFAVSDGGSDQAQAKVAAAPDGGTWVSWFDGIGTGWDVRVQKLDADGNEVFAHGGVLVANRGFSSTQDYGLDVHSSGDALLTFRDDGGVGTQITAARVSGAGALVWGASGIQLTATGNFVAAPKIAGTSDGGAVVAWTENSDVKVQKLNAAGVAQWVADLVITPALGGNSVADMHDAGTSAILSFVNQTGGFGSPRHLFAQKIDASGALQWGAGHVAVFDGGSLQFGNFPDFEPDGLGGGVFSWYDTAGATLQVFAQHVLSNGNEAFPHNGVAGSINASRARVAPHAALDSATGQVVMFWVEQNLTQSQSGLSGQRFSATGVRQWGASGSTLIGLSSTGIGEVHTLKNGDGSFVFWDESPSFGMDTLRAARVDTLGSIDIGPLAVATSASSKSRVDVALNSAGDAVLAWKDTRADSGDIFSQNVTCGGTLGVPAWANLGFAKNGTNGLPALAIEATLVDDCSFDFALTNARASSMTFVVVGITSVFASFSGGTIVPAFEAPFGSLVVVITNGAGEVVIGTTWPGGLPGGTDLFIQAWIEDPVGVGGFASSNAVTATTP